MKVKELRDLLNNKDPNLVQDAFVEVYKMLTKSKKEEVDASVIHILSNQGNIRKDKTNTTNIPALLDEIAYFVSCVEQGYYYIPNRIIPKSERTKWRFKVKNYLKVLLKIDNQSPYYKGALDALIALYKILSKSCGTYLLSSEEPFNAIGIGQDSFYECIIVRMASLGIGNEEITKIISLVIDIDLSRECIYSDFYAVLICLLHIESDKKRVIKVAETMREEQYEKIKTFNGKYSIPYEYTNRLDELNDLIFAFSASIEICKMDIDTYYKYSQRHNDEITLYCMLEIIAQFGDHEDWIAAYEYTIEKKKIKPREQLYAFYKKLVEEFKS